MSKSVVFCSLTYLLYYSKGLSKSFLELFRFYDSLNYPKTILNIKLSFSFVEDNLITERHKKTILHYIHSV